MWTEALAKTGCHMAKFSVQKLTEIKYPRSWQENVLTTLENLFICSFVHEALGTRLHLLTVRIPDCNFKLDFRCIYCWDIWPVECVCIFCPGSIRAVVSNNSWSWAWWGSRWRHEWWKTFYNSTCKCRCFPYIFHCWQRKYSVTRCFHVRVRGKRWDTKSMPIRVKLIYI